MLRPILGITMGDAAGVGPEVIVKALSDEEMYRLACPLVYGDAQIMERAVRIVGAPMKCRAVGNPSDGAYEAETIDIVDLANLPTDLPFAQVDGRAGRAAYEYIERACADAMRREIHAIVTAPLNKEALHLGGLNYPGHTEILGSLMGQTKYSMMLTSPKLRVIHVTTHIALHDVPGRVKKERIADVIALAQETLRLMGIQKPRIAVAGLNPHCGEGGLFGDEDEREIVPAVREAQEKGWNVTGPVPPTVSFIVRQTSASSTLLSSCTTIRGISPSRCSVLTAGSTSRSVCRASAPRSTTVRRSPSRARARQARTVCARH